MNKKKRKIIILVFVFVMIVVVQSLPVFILKNIGMKNMYGKYVNVYYDSDDESGSNMVFDKLENTMQQISNKLNYETNTNTDVYVYKNQSSLHIRKFGLITLIMAPDWYIGDNKGPVALMVSPNTDVNGHNEESIMSAATHELVHTINYRINNKLSYFIDNGVATYLAEQKPHENLTEVIPIPSIEFLDVENELEFGNNGGYQYSYVFIEFLDKEYGWSSVIELIQGNKSYEGIFFKNREEIYNEWIEYLKTYY